MLRSRAWGRAIAVTAVVALMVVLPGCSYGTARPATDITDVEATLRGYVAGDSSSGATYWFEYGTSPASSAQEAPGHVKTPLRTVQAGDRQAHFVQEAVSGLKPDTTYYFRLCARDSQGQTVPGCNDPQRFTTAAAPDVLSVAAQPALYPQFDPQVSDYVTRCAGDPVSMDVVAPAGTEVAVDGQPGRSGRFSESVQLGAGQRFDFSTTSGGSTLTYHVRCLPPSFPTWTYARTGSPSQQWMLTSVVVGASDSRYVVFFDAQGVPVWWHHPADGIMPFDAKLLADGSVAFGEWTLGSFSANAARKYQIRRLDGSLVRTLQTVDTATDFHELQELPNGNYLVVSYRPRDHVDLSAFGKPSDATVLDAEIQEVAPDGGLVSSWNSKDHIDLAETGRWWQINPTTKLPDGRDAWDHVHINSVEPDGDGLIISLRHTDAIYRIDRSDGHVEWKLGGTPTAQSLTVSGDSLQTPLGGQHDARRLPDGTVSVFDNGTQLGRPPRAVRFRIDPQAGTADLVESLSDPDITSSICCGSARKLDSDGWLLAWGGQPIISEYAADKSRIFRLQLPNAQLYRAFPVPKGRVSADQLRQGMDAMFPR